MGRGRGRARTQWRNSDFINLLFHSRKVSRLQHKGPYFSPADRSLKLRNFQVSKSKCSITFRSVLLPLGCSITQGFQDRIFYVFATPASVIRPAETIPTHSIAYCSYQCTLCIKTNYIILHFLHVRHRATNGGCTKIGKVAKAPKKTVEHKTSDRPVSGVELGLFE